MYKYGMLIFLFAFYSCFVKKKVCFSDYMNNHKFNYFSDSSTNSYFIISDTSQVEFIDGSLYAKSKIFWTSCNDYFLVVKEVNYGSGLKVGDTLHVNVISIKKDTLTYVASAYGQSYKLKAIKSD